MTVHKSPLQEQASAHRVTIAVTIAVWGCYFCDFPSEFVIRDVGFLFYPNLKIHLSVFILIEFAFEGGAGLAARKKKRAAGEDQCVGVFHWHEFNRT
jgi:hypothetical protein